MIARVLCRRRLDEGNERLPTAEGQRTSAFLSLPDMEGNAGEEVAGATATVGATPMTRFRSTKEEVNQHEKQSDTSQYQTEPRTSRATPEIRVIEKQLREKERDLQIRGAEVQDVEKVLREKEGDLQVREADVHDVEKVLRVKE